MFHAHEKPALAKPTGEVHAPTAATANKPANATQPPEAEATDKTGNSMSTLSAKVNRDRTRGGVSRSLYIGYLKACGVVVVSAALAISVFAQVRNAKLLFRVESFCGIFVLEVPGFSSSVSRWCRSLPSRVRGARFLRARMGFFHQSRSLLHARVRWSESTPTILPGIVFTFFTVLVEVTAVDLRARPNIPSRVARSLLLPNVSLWTCPRRSFLPIGPTARPRDPVCT